MGNVINMNEFKVSSPARSDRGKAAPTQFPPVTSLRVLEDRNIAEVRMATCVREADALLSEAKRQAAILRTLDAPQADAAMGMLIMARKSARTAVELIHGPPPKIGA